jgi:hypothetical protein
MRTKMRFPASLRTVLRSVVGWGGVAMLAATLPACNNSLSGFGGFVGNTPPVPPTTIFKVLGNVGTPFTLNMSNANASWVVPGVIPLSIAIVNNATPARMIATKLSNDNNLMSVEIDNAGVVLALSSTYAPFGVVSVQTGGTLKTLQPPANPDLRIYVNGPFGQKFQALVEDSKVGFITNLRAPAVFLFYNPVGTVDGQFQQAQNFGSFSINLTFKEGFVTPPIGTDVITTASGGPFVIIQQ